MKCIFRQERSDENDACHWCERFGINPDNEGIMCGRCRLDIRFKTIAEQSTRRKSSTPCRYAAIQKESYHLARPCKGLRMVCQNPKSHLYEESWFSAHCTAERCRWYE